jgi:DNA-binding Xre family transcriptional regulator
VRTRLPELLKERGMTPYGLSKASTGRISLSAAYRLYRSRGRFGFISSATLDAMCDVLAVEPGELLAREPAGKRKRTG